MKTSPLFLFLFTFCLMIPLPSEAESLLTAAANWDLLKVRNIINQGTDLDYQQSQGYTALHLAISVSGTKGDSSDQFSIIKLLVDKGANLDLRGGEEKLSPVHISYTTQHYEIMEYLLKKGANPNIINSEGISPLHDAILSGSTSTTEILIKYGADIDAKSISGETPLHIAVRKGKTEIVDLLINANANLKIKDNFGFLPIHVALWKGYTELVDKFHKKGVSIYLLPSEVKLIQAKLKALNYSIGKIDGIIGSRSINIIKKYQKQSGVTVDGIASTKLLENLVHEVTLPPKIKLELLVSNLDDRDVKLIEQSAKDLGKLKDPEAIRHLVKLFYLDSKGREAGTNFGYPYIHRAAEESLILFGGSSIPYISKVLEGDELRGKENLIKVLQKINDPKATEVLVKNLTDWNLGPKIIDALNKKKWIPTTASEKVHSLIAMRKGTKLKEDIGETEKILLQDIESAKYRTIQNALFTFIGLGHQDAIPKLTNKLQLKGNKTMAVAYLNCGYEPLSRAAEEWAKRNGYKVISSSGNVPVRWGSL